ncbi:MAG: M50 family metallopeptidase [Deltaproteobacteria bacterium]|nr:M50 family metallopeptidase [Deltaproteobacteria bacterium]
MESMGGEFRLGRPFGIPLTINKLLAGFVAVIFGFAFLSKAPLEGAWIVILLVSVLLHEWAHALTARAAGDTVLKVALHLFGGVTYRAGRGGPKADFRITAAGPLVNVIVAGGAWLALRLAGAELPHWAAVVLALTLWINAVLAIFNLLPIHPMDGGRMTRIALSRRVGAGPGARIALGISFATLFLTGGYFVLTSGVNIIVIVLLVQMFMLNVTELRQVGTPSTDETRLVLGRWWRERRERAAARRAERAARSAAPDLEPSPFRRAAAINRDEEVLRDGRKVLEKAADRGLAALSPEERRLLMLHRRLIEIRVDSPSGDPSPDDLRLLEMHVRLGMSAQLH